MKLLLLATIVLSVIPSLLCAQEENVPPKKLRIVPLGEAPELEEGPLSPNGIRTFKEPPVGSFIPRPLALQTGEIKKPLYFGLLHFTPTLTFPGETKQIEIREIKGDKVWFTRNAPTHLLSLGVLYRDPATMSWNDPKMIFLKDDAVTFPARHARFTNTTGKTVYVRVWKKDHREDSEEPETHTVSPGGVLLKPLEPGENVVWIGTDNRKELSRDRYELNGYSDYWTNKIFLEDNERINFFFYKSQIKQPRLPFLMHKKVEKIPRS